MAGVVFLVFVATMETTTPVVVPNGETKTIIMCIHCSFHRFDYITDMSTSSEL